MLRPRKEDYIVFEDDNLHSKYASYINDLEKYCDELERGKYKELQDTKLLTKKECEKYMSELQYAYNHVGTNLREEDLKNAISLGMVGFECLTLEHFNNSADFKYFKLYSDSTLYQRFTKKELISYIHMLHHNWGSCDSWCENLVYLNREIYKQLRQVYLDDPNDDLGAKKMFKNARFSERFVSEGNSIVYFYDDDGDISISFDLPNKTVLIDDKGRASVINMDVLKAIIRQCVELWWFDE